MKAADTPFTIAFVPIVDADADAETDAGAGADEVADTAAEDASGSSARDAASPLFDFVVSLFGWRLVLARILATASPVALLLATLLLVLRVKDGTVLLLVVEECCSSEVLDASWLPFTVW